jgi:hypothetical protein
MPGSKNDLVGCCGAYCKTCPPYQEGICKGCKPGYKEGARDLSKARCAVKKCCMGHKLVSCADCPEFDSCRILQGFYSKNGSKYKKYRESAEFIRKNGYEKFHRCARCWKRACGRLADKEIEKEGKKEKK